MRAGEVAERERVGGDVQAHALHHAHRAQAVHLASRLTIAAEERLVVASTALMPYCLGMPWMASMQSKKPLMGEPGYAGPEMRSALRLEQTLHDQLVAEKNLRALFLENRGSTFMPSLPVGICRNPAVSSFGEPILSGQGPLRDGAPLAKGKAKRPADGKGPFPTTATELSGPIFSS
ncbi:MAG: hypothetical protein WDO13_15095 [Verrucomicrobiota bacterium]